QTTNVPIIFLTARDTIEDEILAFGVGGDDFIKKPYDPNILLLRIEKLLKLTSNNNILTYENLILDTTNMIIKNNDKSIDLTKNEIKILSYLFNNKVAKKEDLINFLWKNNIYIDENTLYVNISRLRDKLKEIDQIDFIKTVRNVGYKI
ncbi:MAG: response regulator transcription factor, partial [bacterium]